jgi:hypothetical protein
MATPTPSDLTAQINGYVTKYTGILGITGDLPVVKIRDNLGSKWLGRVTWVPSRPHTTVLELQRAILGDEPTLERVIAHEMIHHRDALAISDNEVVLLRFGINPESHGASFREGASRINAVMGPDFVTERSDKEYKKSASRKEFVVLITPIHKGKLGWSWAARLGPKATDWVAERVAGGSRLVSTSDERWARGAKIVRYGGYSMPRDPEEAAMLKELFDQP